MAAPPKHWLPAFLRFCELITINSKEEGLVPLRPYDGQLRFLNALSEGLEQDIHDFKVCKARQLGISTVAMALDIFWLYMFPGLQGALIFDTALNLSNARRLISDMLKTPPPEFRVPVESHNRNELVLANGSSLQYMSAGRNSKLGISRAINFAHLSEVGNWTDQDGIDNLKATLAQTNPNRLYIWESTAFGFNAFHNLYQGAKSSPTERALFLGWWTKAIYAFAEDTDQFERWWGEAPYLSEYEAHCEHIVREEYGHDITPAQWAWYRSEASSKGEQTLRQMFPTTEIEAWQETGHSFFPLKRVTADQGFIYSQGTKVGFEGFRYHLASRFTATKLERVGTPEEADLRVWEQPKSGARYVIGVDPAFGREEEADASCIEVFRCFADKLVQVAEYNTPMPETRQVAWVLAHLAGCYRDAMVNLEISGPGAQVMAELRYLKEQIEFGQLKESARDIHPDWTLDNMRWFLWTRPDSLGPNYAYGWKTNLDNKFSMLNRMRDSYATEELLVRSIPLLDEMVTLTQDGFTLKASGRNKDDRVFASGLAHYAWAEWIRRPMILEDMTYDRVMNAQAQVESKGSAVNITEWIVKAMLREAEERAAQPSPHARRLMEI